MKFFIVFFFYISAVFSNYEQIEALGEQFTREFTVFSLGAKNGELGFELAERLPLAKIILVEDNNPKSTSFADELLERLKDANIKNFPLFLNKRITKEEFKTLSEIYYFDIVTFLGESFYNRQIDHGDLNERIDSMLDLGWHTFLECRQNSAIDKILSNKNALEVKTLDNGNNLYHFENRKTTLLRHHLFAPIHTRTINVDYEKSIEIFETERPTKYVILQRQNGLSVIDFKALYGSYPSKEMLQSEKNKVKLNKRQSMYPHELIVTNGGFRLMSPHLPIEDFLPLSDTFLNDLIKAKTKAEVIKLIK
jgi:hypothetical protein